MAKIAILSDIHANLEALTVVLAKCKELGIECFYSLGDIVGYNANPRECLHIVQSLNCPFMVRGNHDEYTGCCDDEMSGFNINAKLAIQWTREQLTEEECAYLVNTPYRATASHANTTLVHATLDTPENWGYIFDSHHAECNFSYQFTQICFCGHSHVPVAFVKKPITSPGDRNIEEITEWESAGILDGTTDFTSSEERTIVLHNGFKYLLNIGSVGQPRNRDPRASFAVLDTELKSVTRYILPYDIAVTQAKVRAAGLPERLALRLASGS